VPGLVFGGEIIRRKELCFCNALKLIGIIEGMVLVEIPLKAQLKPKTWGYGVSWARAVLGAQGLLQNAASAFALWE